MTDNKLYAIISACLTIVAVAGISAGYASCEHQRDRRAECLKKSTAAECAVLFPIEAR